MVNIPYCNNLLIFISLILLGTFFSDESPNWDEACKLACIPSAAYDHEMLGYDQLLIVLDSFMLTGTPVFCISYSTTYINTT